MQTPVTPRKRAPAAVIVALLAFSAACLPTPADPVEYVQRPESIIIQMDDAHASGVDAERAPFDPPDVTLYGDGTLIVLRPDEDGVPRLLSSELPADAVRDLLEFVVDTGFLDFRYDQPAPDGADGTTTTYLYAHTRDAANAVTAVDLDRELADGAGDAFDQYRDIQEVRSRLATLDPVALGGSDFVDYAPERVRLFVQPGTGPGDAGSPAIWPFTAIDLASVASSGDDGRVIEDDPAPEIAELLLPGRSYAQTFQQDGSAYRVSYRPLLPFEENFPEFDRPAPP